MFLALARLLPFSIVIFDLNFLAVSTNIAAGLACRPVLFFIVSFSLIIPIPSGEIPLFLMCYKIIPWIYIYFSILEEAQDRYSSIKGFSKGS